MDYRTAKQEMALHYSNTSDAFDSAAVSTGFSRFVARLGAVARWVIEMPRRRAVLNELRMLTDRELADIGLSRAEVAHVYDRGFVAGRGAA